MNRKMFAPQPGKSQTKESKKKTSLLKDNSWIRKDDSDDKSLDQDTNFGRAVLSQFRENEKPDRFSANKDELDSSRSPVKSDIPEIITTKAIQDAAKTTVTVTTTRTSVVKSPAMSEIFLENAMTDAKTTNDGTKTYTSGDVLTSKTGTYTINSISSAENHFFDITIPTSFTSAQPPPATISYDKSSLTSPTAYTRTLSKDNRSDDLSDTRISIKTVSSTSDRYDRRGSPKGSITTYTTYTDSRPEDYLSDTFTSKSVKTVYTTPERKVSEKDMCTYCHKPMLCETKMILEDMNIKCHASCFKCEVCKSPLEHLKAGDTMWIYQRTVHCENCYGATREKWHR
ncbi:sciellin isoform X2 [Brachyhypopomus gauderio]|uniref:sciellin isoform X2 n=1 Tax=Brachyhypopomus gauderio TaxID=698409 RepID=UPI0040438CBF